MDAVAILLLILKIIGILLLVLLAVILLLVAVIMLTAIKYRFSAQKYDVFTADGNISLWFGLIKIYLTYNQDFIFKVFIFGKEFYSNKKEEKNINLDAQPISAKPKAFKDEDVPNKKSSDEKVNNANIEKNNELKKSIPENKPKPQKSIPENKTKPQKNISENIRQQKINDEKSIDYNSEPKIRRIKMNELSYENQQKQDSDLHDNNNKLDKDYFINLSFDKKKKIIGHIFRFLGRIFKNISPRESKIRLNIGTGDPALTGKIIAMTAIFSGTTGIDIKTAGNFAETEFSGEGFIKGRILIGSLIISTLNFVFKKEIFEIIKLFLKGYGEKDGR